MAVAGYSRPVLTADLVRLYPTLFHTAADGSWPSICEHGLLSTEALLDRWEVAEPTRRQLLTTVRATSTVLEHPQHGKAVVRDQGPLYEPTLSERLDGLSVQEWLALLNERVFFFLRRDRVMELVNARAYRQKPCVIISVDTASLIETYEQSIELARINTGFARPNVPGRRNRATFAPIAAYPHPAREDPSATRPTDVRELTVIGGVPNIMRHVVRVERVVDGEITLLT